MSRGGRHSGHFRDVDGVLVLDKPRGITSNRALQQVRRLFAARKAGHCGSLDPLATGVLPICLGQATRFSGYLLGANKRYRAGCRLGRTTTTGDAEGEVIETREVEVDLAMVEQVCRRFVGEIEQIPPMYSALKHEGQRLYQLAREGKQVERAARKVQIYDLQLISFSDKDLVLELSCSKGTYVRTLAEDIGAALGCGAHLAALRRLAVEPFVEADAVGLEQLQELARAGMEALDACLLPVSDALASFPELFLDSADSAAISQGKRLSRDADGTTGLVRLIAEDGRFLGLGELLPEGVLQAKRLMNTAR